MADARALDRISSPVMAKATIERKTEIDTWRVEVGRAIERARTLSGVSLKEFADAVGRDERQVARWINSTERPQFDAVLAVPRFRSPLIQALSESIGADVDVRVTLRKVG